jgi:phenazine biosynthesis protein phzE
MPNASHFLLNNLPQLCQAPFAMLRREGEEKIWLFQGKIAELDRLDQIQTAPSAPKAGQENFASLNFLPFSTARERGFAVHDDGAKIASLIIEQTNQFSLPDLTNALGNTTITLAETGSFGESDADYATLVRSVITEDIGNGEGANFVIPRWYRAKIANYTPIKALAAYAHLLQQERGTYWTFAFFDGKDFLIGATPERHISLQDGIVKMNPISGTLRKTELDPTKTREQLLAFIHDKKETFELLMVVDEELKMIADFCPTGGQVIGPLLKEMAYLVHSEYLLAGPTQRGVIDLLRNSMFAATVTGSPIESAMRVIKKREPGPRGYYGSVLALIGSAANGSPMLDAPILIRTAQIKADGSIAIGAGTTIVHHSVPEDEVKETHAKAEGIMRAFGLHTASHNRPVLNLRDLIASDDIQLALNLRNKDLSRFWIDYQNDDFTVEPRLTGKTVTIVDNEDSFTHMFAHILRRLGMMVCITSFRTVDLTNDTADLVVIGPGPGDPNNLSDPKMLRLHDMVASLYAGQRRFLCVCLGQQILCRQLGLTVAKKQPIAFQGRQEVIDYFGRKQRVGFYNTFVGHYEAPLPAIHVSYETNSGDIHALRHARFGGMQFHPESILTTNGLHLIQDEMVRLLLPEKG